MCVAVDVVWTQDVERPLRKIYSLSLENVLRLLSLHAEFMALCTVYILLLVQELFLSFLVYFSYYNNQLPVVTQGQYPVSET
jgi:hypothetical protein